MSDGKYVSTIDVVKNGDGFSLVFNNCTIQEEENLRNNPEFIQAMAEEFAEKGNFTLELDRKRKGMLN